MDEDDAVGFALLKIRGRENEPDIQPDHRRARLPLRKTTGSSCRQDRKKSPEKNTCTS